MKERPLYNKAACVTNDAKAQLNDQAPTFDPKNTKNSNLTSTHPLETTPNALLTSSPQIQKNSQRTTTNYEGLSAEVARSGVNTQGNPLLLSRSPNNPQAPTPTATIPIHEEGHTRRPSTENNECLPRTLSSDSVADTRNDHSHNTRPITHTNEYQPEQSPASADLSGSTPKNDYNNSIVESKKQFSPAVSLTVSNGGDYCEIGETESMKKEGGEYSGYTKESDYSNKSLDNQGGRNNGSFSTPPSNTTAEFIEEMMSSNASLSQSSFVQLDYRYQNWVILLGSLLIQMVIMGLNNTAGVYQNYYLNYHFINVSAIDLTWISTLTSLCPYVFTWLSVLTVNQIGPRTACGIGTVICTAALLMASFSTQYWQLILTQGLLFGIGGAFFYVPTFILPTHYFTGNTGLILGIAAAGNNIGGMWLSPLVETLIEKYGISWTLRINCFMVLFVGALCSPFMIKKPLSVTEQSLQPTTLPSPVPSTEHVNNNPRASSSSNNRQEEIPWYKDFNISIFKDIRFDLMFLIALIAPWAYFGSMNYTPSSAHILGFGDGSTSTLATLFNACGVVGQIGSGFLVDMIGPINVTLISLTMCTISILGLWLPARSYVLFVIFSIVIGLFSGNYDNTLPSITGRLFGEEKTAGLMGFLSIGVGIGSLAGIAAEAQIYDSIDNRGVFHAAIWFCGIASLVATLIASVLWFLHFRIVKRNTYIHKPFLM
ncbi:hypothetical protein H4219_005178 [Mycoemilia scoparia]|uniref:Major facilitator superfamily (MFS) profile domain-containing protein n=1 Tax=Mycoemilia scoparia TaxID=417184 RepID=A0A9W8DPT8_9FUNG|nr:hypothetical protein H4219_005178 [Mycoemilia scoparia]